MLSLVQSAGKFRNQIRSAVVLGKTIMNEVFMFDLCKMPHILIAGATGQGKSVGLNALIASLLYKKHPERTQICYGRPPRWWNSAFTLHRKALPGANCPATTTKPSSPHYTKVIQTCHSLTIELDDRYKLLNLALNP
jgi:S-DNA-T family DNA segregation ATPase FtsK/SpoIIIE